jgi:hypothetical protein
MYSHYMRITKLLVDIMWLIGNQQCELHQMQRLAPQGYWPVHAAKGAHGPFPSGSRQLLKAVAESIVLFAAERMGCNLSPAPS